MLTHACEGNFLPKLFDLTSSRGRQEGKMETTKARWRAKVNSLMMAVDDDSVDTGFEQRVKDAMLIQWLTDTFKSDPNGKVLTTDVYPSYAEWCNAIGSVPQHKIQVVGRFVERWHPKQRRPYRYFFTGLSFKDDRPISVSPLDV